MSPVKKVRVSDSVIDAIKEMIAGEGFKPGDKFYSENELTQKLEVSRSSIREALRILEATGQISVRHGKGIFLAEGPGLKLTEFSTWLKANEQAIRDTFEVRLIIEPRAVGYAAERASAADIEKMDETLAHFARTYRAGKIEEAIIWDGNFHRHLAGATRNKTLYMLMKSMITNMPAGWVSCLFTPGRIDQTIGEHQAIFEAVRKKDKIGAENAMTRHLLNALHDIFNSEYETPVD